MEHVLAEGTGSLRSTHGPVMTLENGEAVKFHVKSYLDSEGRKEGRHERVLVARDHFPYISYIFPIPFPITFPITPAQGIPISYFKL